MGDSSNANKLIILYCIVDICRCLSNMMNKVFSFLKNFQISRRLHNTITNNLLRASFTQYFNKILTGRLMNRLSKDIYNIDISLPLGLEEIFKELAFFLSSFILFFEIKDYYFLPVMIILFIFCFWFLYYYMNIMREVSRLEAVSKSPILELYTELARGLTYIRNCVKTDSLESEFASKIDQDLKNQIVINGII